jgi:hypothetical protein
MNVADQDTDGSHIKGLLINFIHSRCCFESLGAAGKLQKSGEVPSGRNTGELKLKLLCIPKWTRHRPFRSESFTLSIPE